MHGSGLAVAGAIPSPTILRFLHTTDLSSFSRMSKAHAGASVRLMVIKSATRFCEASCCTYVANKARTEIRGKTACAYGLCGMGLPSGTGSSASVDIVTFHSQHRDEYRLAGLHGGYRKRQFPPFTRATWQERERRRR